MESNTSESTNASSIEVIFEEVKAIPTARVRTGCPVESDKMYGVCVDLLFSEGKNGFSGSRQEWFPKSLCTVERVEQGEGVMPHYYLTAPHWLLEKKKVKYEKK